MKLQYNGQEQIPVSPDAVWAFVTDPHRVALCLPDLVESEVLDPTHFNATVKVGVGPVRGKFKFKFEILAHPDTKRIDLKASGGGFGSVVDMVAGATVVPAGATTSLDWDGQAEMRGPVAAVGGRVLDGQARKLIEQTFANVRDTLSKP